MDLDTKGTKVTKVCKKIGLSLIGQVRYHEALDQTRNSLCSIACLVLFVSISVDCCSGRDDDYL